MLAAAFFGAADFDSPDPAVELEVLAADAVDPEPPESDDPEEPEEPEEPEDEEPESELDDPLTEAFALPLVRLSVA